MIVKRARRDYNLFILDIANFIRVILARTRVMPLTRSAYHRQTLTLRCPRLQDHSCEGLTSGPCGACPAAADRTDSHKRLGKADSWLSASTTKATYQYSLAKPLYLSIGRNGQL